MSTLSGWNCTPCTGSSRCRTPITMPSRVPGAELEALGQRLVDDQGVVARGRERVGQAGEDAAPVVADLVGLAVHRGAGAAHHAAVDLADRLVAEADAEHRQARGAEVGDRVHADAGLVGRAGAGRDDEVRRPRGGDLVERHVVVALDRDLGAELAQVLHEVVGERVVVVDHEHARRGDDGLARAGSRSTGVVIGRTPRGPARRRAAAPPPCSASLRTRVAGSESATMPAPACR